MPSCSAQRNMARCFVLDEETFHVSNTLIFAIPTGVAHLESLEVSKLLNIIIINIITLCTAFLCVFMCLTGRQH